MASELAKTYDFRSTESRIYEFWEKNGYFSPSNDPRKPGFDPAIKPFVISIPPPNITGELHLGHALFVAMEDMMIRYHRMKGIPTLWVPGTDHASIATQLLVEQMINAEGITREQLGREKFLERCWEWKESMAGSSPARSAGLVLPVIGAVSGSRWMPAYPRRFVKPSSGYMTKV